MSISSVGLGSGLDVKDIVAKLVALEQKPIAALQTRAAAIQARMSAFAQLKSQVTNWQAQAQKLASLQTWQAHSVQSSDPALLTGKISGPAAAASLSVTVQQLAQAQTTGSGRLAAGSAPGTGTLTIACGQWQADGSFSPDAAAATTIAIGPDDDSLDKLAAKINAAQSGVRASVLRDAHGERLTLQSARTGADAGFRVDAEENPDAPGLARFSYPGGQGLPDVPDAPDGMRCTQVAQDTLAHINGLEFSSHDATLTQVLPGVDLQLLRADPDTSVRVDIAVDSAPARSALRDFVQSYNALASALRTMTAYDPQTRTAGTLQGESSATALQGALRRLLGEAPGADNRWQHMSQIGLDFNKDGSLILHEDKLEQALQHPKDMARWFAADLPGQDQDGLAVRLKNFADGLLGPDGMFAGKESSMKQTLQRNQQDQERLTHHVASYESRLLAQYTRLDAQMSTLGTLEQYIQQQVAQWNRAGKL